MNRHVWMALIRCGVVALTSAGVALLMEATVGLLDGESAVVASFLSMGVSIALVVVLILVEVKAWRVLVDRCAAAGDELDGVSKVMVAAALWFAGGLPMNLVSIVRPIMMTGDVSTVPEMQLAQLGITFVLLVFAVLRLYPVLRY